MLMERIRTDEKHTMSTEVVSRSQSLVHRRSSKCMKEGGGVIHWIRAVCMEETIRCAASAAIEEVINENVTTLLNMFSRHRVEVLANLMKVKLQGQGCAPCFRSVLRSVL